MRCRIVAESAGLTPGTLTPLAVKVLREEGFDISGKTTQSVFDVVKRGDIFAYVITVCDETNAERCPIFPGITTRLHWNFSDPSGFEGNWEEKLNRTRNVREEIREKLKYFCAEACGRKNLSPSS